MFLGFCLFFGYLKSAGAGVFDYQWVKTRSGALKPYAYIVVHDVDMVCRQVGAQSPGHINACATLFNKDCNIYLPEDAPGWLVRHEEKHCEGYVHP